MAWKTVASYNLGYSIPNKQFSFYYTLAGETLVRQILVSPAEFSALGDMFRNEGPISFNTDGQYFSSAAEKVGEQESQP